MNEIVPKYYSSQQSNHRMQQKEDFHCNNGIFAALKKRKNHSVNVRCLGIYSE